MTGKKANMIASLVLLLRLRQACSHPAMVTGSLGMDAAAMGSSAASDSVLRRRQALLPRSMTTMTMVWRQCCRVSV